MSTIKRLKKEEKGATALEFGLILPTFFILFFGIIEFGLVMHISSLVENAAHEGARKGITGEEYADLNQEGLNREDFLKRMIIDRIGLWVTHDSQVSITTETYGSITELGADGEPTEGTGFGNGGEAVVYNVTYYWDIMMPIVGAFIGKEGQFPITSKVAVKNEDFCGRRRCFGI